MFVMKKLDVCALSETKLKGKCVVRFRNVVFRVSVVEGKVYRLKEVDASSTQRKR